MSYSHLGKLVLLSLLLAHTVVVRAEITVDDDGSFVIDRAGIVEASTDRKLEDQLRELEEKTTAQVKLLTVPTTEGEDFFGFVQRHADLWKLGQEHKDNGVLIGLAVQERKVRIHTGYGIEGVLPDGWCGSACRDVTERYFKHGQYSQGLDELVTVVVKEIASDAGVQIASVPTSDDTPTDRQSNSNVRFYLCITVSFILVVVICGIASGGRRRRRGSWESGTGWGRASGGDFSGGDSTGGGSFGGGGDFGGGGGGASW